MEEEYGLSWVGKSQAKIAAELPVTTHLVKKSNTEGQNMLIKGDNLEVLKHLQNDYKEKVKMIYIDPPYNTGSKFVYADNLKYKAEDLVEFYNITMQEARKRLKNLGKQSNKHSAWLSFMYPRLKLGRELLRDDGVIFISIDDNEQAQLKLLCDEIFGEDNFVGQFVWQKKTGASNTKHLSSITENILLYARNINSQDTIIMKNYNAHDIKRYKLSDEYIERRGKYYHDTLDRRGTQYSDAMNYPIKCPDGSITYPNGRKEFKSDGWTWNWGKDKVDWGLNNGFIIFNKSKQKSSGWSVCYKNYLKVDNKDNLQGRSVSYRNLILGVLNQDGTKEIKYLFDDQRIFSYPKPVDLIKHFVTIATKEDDIILDFFAGSGTTAHAVMQLNSEDGGNRKFIMVQLDEPCKDDSEAKKAGYNTIFDICKERVIRSANKIKEENPMFHGDLGFEIHRTVDIY